VYRWISGIAVGSLAVALLGVGCGDEDESTASSNVTKAQFVKNVNAVCKKTQEDRFNEIGAYDQKTLAKGEKPESGPNLLKKMEDVLLPSMNKQLEELKALDVPEASAAKYEKMLQSLEGGIEKLEEEGVVGLTKGEQLEAFEKEAAALNLACSA
jgi:hypothetical protein